MIYDVLAKRLIELRHSKNITQINMAVLIGLTQEHISSLERGKAKPSIDTLIKIAKFYHCSLDYLLGLSDTKDPVVSKEILSSKEKDLLANYNACNKREQEWLLLLSAVFSNKKIKIELSENTVVIKQFISNAEDE